MSQAQLAISAEQQAINTEHRQLLAQIQHDQQRLLHALGVPPEPVPAPGSALAAPGLPPLLPAVAAEDEFGSLGVSAVWTGRLEEEWLADFGPVVVPLPPTQ